MDCTKVLIYCTKFEKSARNSEQCCWTSRMQFRMFCYSSARGNANATSGCARLSWKCTKNVTENRRSLVLLCAEHTHDLKLNGARLGNVHVFTYLGTTVFDAAGLDKAINHASSKIFGRLYNRVFDTSTYWKDTRHGLKNYVERKNPLTFQNHANDCFDALLNLKQLLWAEPLSVLLLAYSYSC